MALEAALAKDATSRGETLSIMQLSDEALPTMMGTTWEYLRGLVLTPINPFVPAQTRTYGSRWKVPPHSKGYERH
jgi:hypothetical protein